MKVTPLTPEITGREKMRKKIGQKKKEERKRKKKKRVLILRHVVPVQERWMVLS
jgi:hypothetical protein